MFISVLPITEMTRQSAVCLFPEKNPTYLQITQTLLLYEWISITFICVCNTKEIIFVILTKNSKLRVD